VSVSVRQAPTASVLTRSRPTESHRNRRPVCWQCGGTGHLRKECPQRPSKVAANKRDCRWDCAIGGRGNTNRQMSESIPLLREEAMAGRVHLSLRGISKCSGHQRQELETALKGKAGGQWRVTCRRVRAVAACTPDGRDRVAQWREQLARDRVKARQNRVTNSSGFNEGHRVWLYRPTRNGGKSLNHHSDQRRGLPAPAVS
jgi:hypothetical protein